MKVAYSCFVDSSNKRKFEKESIRLVWSLVEKASVRLEDIFFTCDKNCGEDYLNALKSIGVVNVSMQERFSSFSPPSNKWLQLDGFDYDGYEYLVINDCDKVYISFSEMWCNGVIRAAPFVARPRFELFEDIFEKFDLGFPRFLNGKADKAYGEVDSRQYINNHNGGMIIISIKEIHALRLLWKKWIDILHNEEGILGKYHRNLDQIAFSLACHDMNVDVCFLPKSLDMGLNVRNLDLLDSYVKSGQFILHAHSKRYGKLSCSNHADSRLAELVSTVNKEFDSWVDSVGIGDFLGA